MKEEILAKIKANSECVSVIEYNASLDAFKSHLKYRIFCRFRLYKKVFYNEIDLFDLNFGIGFVGSTN